MYCDFLHDGTIQMNKHKLQVARNSSLRAIKCCKYDYLSDRLRGDLQIDNLTDTRKKNAIKIVYRGLHDPGPPALNSLFEFYEPTSSLRSENKLQISPIKTRTVFAANDLAVQGSKYWNDTNDTVKTSATLVTLKNTLKHYGPV